MNALIRLKKTTPVFVIAFVLAWFALSPTTQAVVPPPDGGYPGQNTAEGQSALLHLAGGTYNTALGWASLGFNVTGNYNTGVGAATLLNNTASENTATGAGALLNNTEGDFNTANGAFALFFNTTGERNTATGDSALFGNTTGNLNTANGNAALVTNTTGERNTAMGAFALQRNNANDNTATGWRALYRNTEGSGNMAIGTGALSSNTVSDFNTAVGAGALSTNTGSSNTAIGYLAGFNLTAGFGNVCIGREVVGVAGESATTRIRNIGSTPIVGGTNVVVDGTGGIGDQRLGYASSSRRYKEDIKPVDKASETLFALKPVSFEAKGDPAHVRHYGLIAEDVVAVNPDLVVYNPEGQPETLKFDSINTMLLNEFLKEHRKNEEQQKQINVLTAQLKEQAAQIQKVSAQLEASKPAPQVVNNP